MTDIPRPKHARRSIRAAVAAVIVVTTTTAFTAGTATPVADRSSASASTIEPVTLTLPAPTGRLPIGRTDLHLVDQSRNDPWAPASGKRELMISLWYPTTAGDRHPYARVMSARAAAHFGRTDAADNSGVPAKTVDWAATRTHAHLGARVRPGRWPTLLYGAGLGDPRTWDTALVEDLTSRGYLVVTVDHPREASEVEFPAGRVVDNRELLEQFATTTDPITILKKILRVRVADTRFVLRTLLSSTQPWSRSIDAGRIGMFGHSGGGFEALELMRQNPILKIGADLDGTVGYDEKDTGPGLSPLAHQGLDRPFLLAGSASNDHYTSTSWTALWRHSRGWRRDLHFAGTEHASFTDAESYLPQVASRLPAGTVSRTIGWADPARTVSAQRTYLAAFADRWLRHGPSLLFDPRYAPFQGVSLVP